MVNKTNDPNNIQLSLPITEEAHSIAQALARQQPTLQKAEQVKLNTLAVSVVDTYLQMMSITTNIEASDSRNPFVCLGSDVADLMVTNLGRLECRPVKVDQHSCHIPIEVWQDRIGYVAVQLDEALEEATLVGFMSTVEAEEISLRKFQPIRALLQELHILQYPAIASARTPFINLSQWLRNEWQDAVEIGWQILETLFETPQVALIYRSLRDDPLSHPARRGKRLILETPQGAHSLILVMTPEVEHNTVEPTQELTITVEVVSADPAIPLPAGLRLLILDGSGELFKEVQSLPEDEYARSRIGGLPGERFSVQVALDDTRLIENFII